MVQCDRCGDAVPGCSAILCSGCENILIMHGLVSLADCVQCVRPPGDARVAGRPNPFLLTRSCRSLTTSKLFFKSTLGSYSERLKSVCQRLIIVEKVQYNILQLRDQVLKLEEDFSKKNQWTHLNTADIKGVHMKGHENLSLLRFKQR